MKRKKTPRSSQLLFEPLESRLLLDATNVAADDGPMPQTSASETGPAVEVSAEATPTAGGSMAPSGIAGREPAGDATALTTQGVWDDCDVVHVFKEPLPDDLVPLA